MKTSNKENKVQHEHKVHHEHHEHHAHNEAGHPAHAHKQPWWKAPGRAYMIFSVLIMVVLVAVILALVAKNNPAAGGGSAGPAFKGDKVKVEFYVMSKCPYGTQVENTIAPVLKTMNGAVDFQLNYIVKETAPGVFQSLHGDTEVTGDIVQLCAKSYYPDKYFDMIICQNKDAANMATNWEDCAKGLGMDTATLSKCMNSDEGKNLLRTSMQRTQARGASGSPTIYFADVSYSGGRESLDFQRAICKYSTHPSCASIPKCAVDTDCTEQPGKEGTCVNPGAANAACTYSDPVPVNYIVLSDDKCTTCDTTRIVQVSQQLFLGGKPRLVDAKSDEGKALVAKYSLTVVPAYIFDANVVNTKSWTTMTDLAGAFDKLSDGKYRLKDQVTGATYFVSEAAKKAHYDAVGVVKGDNKPQIDFFVMAFCPYGNQAEEAIAPVFNLLKGKAIFNPHYVIYSQYNSGSADFCMDSGNLCSMHGIQEVHQDVRELCVNKYLGIQKWFDFALAINQKCNYQNADSCWEDVAKGVGLDTAKIKTCEANEATTLLKAEQVLGDKLSVQGSPTVFIDGDEYAGARAPDGFKTSLCAAFDTAPAECKTTLAGANATAASAAAPAAGGCGV